MRLISYRYRRTTLISATCASILVGIAISQLGWSIPLWLCLLSLPLLLFAKKKTSLALVIVFILGTLFGIYRGAAVQHELAQYNAFYNQKVAVSGTVSEDPTYNDKRQSVWYITNLTLKLGDKEQKLPGKARITTLSIAEVRRGDTVTVQGTLRDGFGNYQASMYFATLQQHTPSTNWMDTMRYQFATGVYNVLPEPHASLGLGFLTGLKSQLPEDLNDQLRALALTHIVVASGYNLTILIRISRKLLAKSSKFQALVGSVALMLGMLAITGMSPSMTRASLVTSLALAAWYYGRNVHPVLLLLLSAAVTAYTQPLYLWSDAGWWLSFTAFAGVLLVAPLLEKRFIKPESKFSMIKQIAIETTAAQLTTLPVILLLFGQFAVFGLIANILVVPLVPLAMLCTFIAGLGGIFLPQLGAWMAIPAHLVLSYIVGIVRFMTQLPWTTLAISIGWIQALLAYGSISIGGAILYAKLNHSYRKQRSIVE